MQKNSTMELKIEELALQNISTKFKHTFVRLSCLDCGPLQRILEKVERVPKKCLSEEQGVQMQTFYP